MDVIAVYEVFVVVAVYTAKDDIDVEICDYLLNWVFLYVVECVLAVLPKKCYVSSLLYIYIHI